MKLLGPCTLVFAAAICTACGGSSTVDGTVPTTSSSSTTPSSITIAGTVPTTSSSATTTSSSTFKGEVWADNWFQFYLGSTLVATDSEAITTERSFNSEAFTFTGTYPLELNFIIKDYKQDNSGLEYIGTSQQQMGDGGFIAQITDTQTGKVVAVSSSAWRCTVIQKAPLNKGCAKDANPIATCGFSNLDEPTGWKEVGYDTRAWESAREYTAEQIGAKQGYFNIAWNSAAKLIWTSDLLSDNTLLCKATVTRN
jgi:hypothetical protein